MRGPGPTGGIWRLHLPACLDDLFFGPGRENGYLGSSFGAPQPPSPRCGGPEAYLQTVLLLLD